MTWEPSAHGIAALRFLWNQYKNSVSYEPIPEEDWVAEFFFCLLGGYGIKYELNSSAFSVLRHQGLFDPGWYSSPGTEIERLLCEELQTPQFRPARKNGELRSYRFYRQKAGIIARAGHWLHRQCSFRLEELLDSDPKLNRTTLLDCPGFGYKTASWFLRNIGSGRRLAILDVHICRVLTDFEIIPRGLSPTQNYLEIERIFDQACRAIGAASDVMDLILWTWERGGGVQRYARGQEVRSHSCR